MNWIFEKIGHYLIITNNSSSLKLTPLLCELKVRQTQTASTIFTLEENGKEIAHTFSSTDTYTLDGVAKTFAEIIAWLYENTGHGTSSGGSSAGGYVPSPYIVEKVFFEEDLVPDPHVIAFTACEAFIEFTGTGGKFCGIAVEDGFGRGFGNNTDNLEYQFPDCQSPLVGRITITYGRKEL